jgi:malonyl-CoA O-methyltransferase
MSRRPPVALDRRAVRAGFARAAATYDANAVLQREIASRLAARLEYIRLDPQCILDLGCGTGILTDRLQQRYPRAGLVGVDLAMPMVQAARRRSRPRWLFRPGRPRVRFVNAAAEALPFADGSFDLIASSLVLQWCDPEAVFRECRRVLRPGGLLVFTSFGPDTLRELRSAWRAVDNAVHVHDFVDMHDLGDALVRARLADPVMDSERLTLTYAGVREVLRDLKGIGAHNAASARPAGLTGKARFARFCAAYEDWRQPDGRLPASYEVVYGHAWAPATKGEERGARGEEWKPVSVIRRP